MAGEMAKKQTEELAAPDYIREVLGDEYDSSLKENIDGERNAAPVIKILHGADLFRLPDMHTTDKFSGVILFKIHNRMWYENKDDDSKRPPDCSSRDAITGSLPRDNKTGRFGDCRSCSLSQLIRLDDKTVKASPCGEKVRLLVLMDGSSIPYVLSAPTKSLREVSDYMSILVARGLPYFSVRTQFSLVHNSKGQMEWNELKMANTGVLTKEDLLGVLKLRKEFDERVKSNTIVEVDNEPEVIPANF